MDWRDPRKLPQPDKDADGGGQDQYVPPGVRRSFEGDHILSALRRLRALEIHPVAVTFPRDRLLRGNLLPLRSGRDADCAGAENHRRRTRHDEAHRGVAASVKFPEH